jgi:hypothetical protein
MAFLRTAQALVVHPRTTQAGWSKVRTAKVAGQPTQNLVAQASDILGQAFDPSKYLLTHCTIVASVDVVDVPGVKLGSVKEGGKKISRKYGNYRVTAETDPYINNNLDCFSRAVLLKSYRTFIGGHNFLEHVQVEDLSKGRIIDAVARDIGDSIYVDILVATDRKHASLVEDIEAGRLATLSMGCSVEETICTKCGNVAVDETELCECVKYAKGNMFLDERGKRHRIAELCGHESLDPTGGVTFIEGSWVASPAFTGAVMRNIITPDSLTTKAALRVQEVLASPPPQWVGDAQRKAASELIAQEHAVVGRVTDRRTAFDFGDPTDDGGDAAPSAPSAPKGGPLDDLEDRVTQDMIDRVEKRIRDEMDKRPPRKSPEESTSAPNDTLIKEASRKVAREAYAASVAALAKTASSDADLLNKVAVLDAHFGVRVPVPVYRTVLSVGSVSKHGSVEGFLKVCRDTVGRPLSQGESRALVRLGRVLDSITPDNIRSLR